ncbi:molybdopterin synthase, large subunit [Sterolibacterium denitrificans]|uniref:Molybdopterin synthase catalytic subunit n=1 Tax=Sterolibacterium denitrificans TaxID=157592 RepID=A0A7Z7MVT6_9PROT|nr:molybdopterin synthase catalytic subunit MoaE [Sterolibacterium denitrificans]SMB28407.1 molybdopterin synthase, large subunit [Sterolibacterium denitrificans]
MSVSVQREAFDVAAEIAALSANQQSIGAIASFVGLVRDVNEDAAVSGMTLEHYPGMTERALEEIVNAAHDRWQLARVRVIHRYGPLSPGDGIVLVLVASAHRGEAFAACEFIMDYLKTRAPFWKKEVGAGDAAAARWVDARETDDRAAARWER